MRNIKNRRFRLALRCVVGMLALSGILAVLLPAWLGMEQRNFEMLASIRMQIALLMVPILIVALLLRSRLVIGIALVAAITCFAGMVPWYFGKDSAGDEVGTSIKVISFNVLQSSKHYGELMKFVRAEKPDVVAFQEVSDAWSVELGTLRTILPYRYSELGVDMELHSRFPISGTRLTLIGKMRGLLECDLNVDGREVTVIATHCYPQIHFGVQGFAWRNEQLVETIPAAVKRLAGRSVLVVGDLNATMWSPHYKTLIELTGLRNSRRGFGIHPTCGEVHKGAFFTVPFDHCLVDDSFVVRHFRSGPDLGSDHLPIVVELGITL